MQLPIARTWLQAGRATLLPDALSATFDTYVEHLPWAGTTSLDWSCMPPSTVLNVAGLSPADVYARAKTTRLAKRNDIAVWYSRREGGIVVPFRDGIEALDELY